CGRAFLALQPIRTRHRTRRGRASFFGCLNSCELANPSASRGFFDELFQPFESRLIPPRADDPPGDDFLIARRLSFEESPCLLVFPKDSPVGLDERWRTLLV